MEGLLFSFYENKLELKWPSKIAQLIDFFEVLYFCSLNSGLTYQLFEDIRLCSFSKISLRHNRISN